MRLIKYCIDIVLCKIGPVYQKNQLPLFGEHYEFITAYFFIDKFQGADPFFSDCNKTKPEWRSMIAVINDKPFTGSFILLRADSFDVNEQIVHSGLTG